MARDKAVIVNFSGGEIDPELNGRVDLAIFGGSVSFMKDFLPSSKGAARYRYGSEHVGNGQGFHIPYTYNDEFSYLVLVRNATLNFMKDGALIFNTATDAIDSVSLANPCVVGVNGHSLLADTEIYIAGIGGTEEILGGPYLVKNPGANDFELFDIDGVAIDSTGFTAWTAGGVISNPVVVASPWSLAEADEINYHQLDDTLYIVQKDNQPRTLIRGAGHVNWTLALHAPAGNPFTTATTYPRVVFGYENRLGFMSTITDPMKVFFAEAIVPGNMVTGTGATDPFNWTIASKLGELIYNAEGLQDFIAIFSSERIYTGKGKEGEAISVANFSTKPRNSVGSAPYIVTALTDNRVIFVQSGRKKIRSIQNDSANEGPLPDYLNLGAIHLSKASLKNSVAKSASIKKIIFQEGDPNLIYALRDDGKINIMAIDDNEQIIGWARWQPTGVGAAVYSIGKTKSFSGFDDIWMVVQRTINGATRYYTEYWTDPPTVPLFLDYYTGVDNKTTDEESFLFDMFETQKRLRYLDSSLRYDGSTAGLEASVTITPSAITGVINLTTSGAFWVAGDVGREVRLKGAFGWAKITSYTSTTIVGALVKRDFEDTNAVAAGDWYLTTNIISGLRHLEGETVQIIADGGNHINKTVDSAGQITLASQFTYVFVGFHYLGMLITNELNKNQGELLAEAKTVYRIDMQFLNTLGAKYGTDPYDMTAVEFRSSADFTDRPVPLFTGDIDVPALDTSSLNKKIVVQQSSPLPCTLTAIKISYQKGRR